MTSVYTAQATAVGGREGHVRSSDGTLDMPLIKPASLGGPENGNGTNPEQLFAAGYAACFESSAAFASRMRNLNVETTVTAKVDLHKSTAGYQISVHLCVLLKGATDEQAEQVVAAADKACPYSKALRGNVEVTHSWSVE